MAKRKTPKTAAEKPARMKFQLQDGADDNDNDDIAGRVEVKGHSLDIFLDGYGTYDTADGYGPPVSLDYFDGKLQVVVWPDINEQEPETVDLEEAQLANRLIDEEEIKQEWEKFIEKHIHPSRLFAIATGAIDQAEKDTKHFEKCRLCCRALRVYQERK